jgi:hypothetical protein
LAIELNTTLLLLNRPPKKSGSSCHGSWGGDLLKTR